MSKFFFFLIFWVVCNVNAQVGIGTSTIDPSAILELNSSNSSNSNKKGFLGPKVNLNSAVDTQTIPSPAVGLLIYNLLDAGTYPNEVFANRFYYWNGTRWSNIGTTNLLERYLSNRSISFNSTSNQSFTYAEINSTSAANGGLPVSFLDTDVVINSGDIASKTGNNTFTINITGLYEVSGFVNYNPNRITIGSPQRGCALNIKLQISNNNGSTWTDVIGNRTLWGIKTNNLTKTAVLISTPLNLIRGQLLRMVVQNPFALSDASSIHGENPATSPSAALPAIVTSTRNPISKNLTLTLLDYDIQ